MSVSVQLTRLDCTRWSKLLTGPTMAHGPGPAIHHWFSRLASMSSLDASIFRFLFGLFGFSLFSYVQKPPPPPPYPPPPPLKDSECQCPANSTGLYTLVKTADRSYNGTWTWSSNPPLVQQTGLDVIVRCKYLSFFVCLVLVCFRMCKSPPPPLKEKEVFDRPLDENAIFCPPKQAKHKNQTITLPCKKERRLKNNYNGYFLLFDKNGGKI